MLRASLMGLILIIVSVPPAASQPYQVFPQSTTFGGAGQDIYKMAWAVVVDLGASKAWNCYAKYDETIKGVSIQYVGRCETAITTGPSGHVMSPGLQTTPTTQIVHQEYGLPYSGDSSYFYRVYWLIDQSTGKINFCDFGSVSQCWDFPSLLQ